MLISLRYTQFENQFRSKQIRLLVWGEPKEDACLKYRKKINDNPLLSRSTLKCLVYCQVFWVEVRGLQEQCMSIWEWCFITKFPITCFTFSHFLFFFFSFFNVFFCLLLWQTIFRWLASFVRFFVLFQEKTLQYLKKIQVQIIVFNKKADVKISRISNSKTPP